MGLVAEEHRKKAISKVMYHRRENLTSFISTCCTFRFANSFARGLNYVHNVYITPIKVLWQLLIWATGCQIPVVAVLSQSMHPTYNKVRGLQLEMYVAHRVMKVRQHATRGWEIITQGDNNHVDDSQIYASGTWLSQEDVMGRVYWSIPYLGWFTILTNQYPLLQYIVLVLLGVYI